MAILAECPLCHRKKSVRNKFCAGCGEGLDKEKRNGKVRFWIAYQLDGKQRKEFVGTSIEEARDADGKAQSTEKGRGDICRFQAHPCRADQIVHRP